MKVSDLEGALLDYWVAKAAGLHPIPNEPRGFFYWIDDGAACSGWWSPSTIWSQGGPLIEREQITIIDCAIKWVAMVRQTWGWDGPWSKFEAAGPTPLVAAMRAYVASKYGEEVPDEGQ
jgi:hypothetical protein